MKFSKPLVKLMLLAGFALAPLAVQESVQAESLPEDLTQHQEVVRDTSSEIPPVDSAVEQTESMELSVESQTEVTEKVNEEPLAPTIEEEAAAPTAHYIEAKEKESQSSTVDQAKVERVSGDTRYTNAVEVSKAGWTKSNDVFLANGDNYADALTGAPLAHLRDAPIL